MATNKTKNGDKTNSNSTFFPPQCTQLNCLSFIEEEVRKAISVHNEIKTEIKYEATLISQASFMAAAFAFSTTSLFAVWRMGIDNIKTIPNKYIHFDIGLITLFLLLSVFFSVKALMPSKADNYREDISIFKQANKKRSKCIKCAIRFWFIAAGLVFLSVIVFLCVFYFFSDFTNGWFNV